MVKKHKGGRRQILQLEDKKSSHGDWEPSSTSTLNKESTPLDSQVADFLKEIDAMTVGERPDERSCEIAEKAFTSNMESCSVERLCEGSKSEVQLNVQKGADSDPSVGVAEGYYCPWQEICDETTGYNYYWNMMTNEVTWDCPPEYTMCLKYAESVATESAVNSDELNLNEVLKTKKKKEPSKLPEGAIVPISYFGESSSDEASDNENKSKQPESLKSVQPTEVKVLSGQKSKTTRKDAIGTGDANSTSREVIGPQLPPNFKFPRSAALMPSSCVLGTESETYSSTSFFKDLEMGLQMPSTTSKGMDKNSTDGTKESCSSALINSKLSQHTVNVLLASSSTRRDSWEAACQTTSKKSITDRENGEESPDSTVKHGTTVRKADVSEHKFQTSSYATVFRPVVEYDSFTDDEEDTSSSITSSSKCINIYEQNSVPQALTEGDIAPKNEKKLEFYPLASEHTTPRVNYSKRNAASETNEDACSFKKSKRNDAIDIDRLFADHASNEKFGLGFSREKQLNLENDKFSSAGKDGRGFVKGYSDYKAISFVKSDVFDLSALNQNCYSAAAEEQFFVPKDSVRNSEQSMPKDFQVGSGTCEGLIETRESKPPKILEEEICKEKKDDSLCKVLFYRGDEDIDEIDKALCEALEAKRVLQGQSSESSSAITSKHEEQKCNEVIFKGLETLPKAEIDGDSPDETDSGKLMAHYANLSATLVDKLTFLISNHSALISLSGLLVQLQTRILDWQASALESKYFISRVQEVHQYLHHYEMAASSGDWICQWDRQNKRYYYVNTKTRHSQWNYPGEQCNEDKTWICSSTNGPFFTEATKFALRDEPQTVSSSVPEGHLPKNRCLSIISESKRDMTEQFANNSLSWILLSSPPPPPPGIDSPPPPPPQTPPPKSPPLPPPDSTELEAESPEDMDLENSNDSSPLPFISKPETNVNEDTHIQYANFIIRSSEQSPETFPCSSVSSVVSSTSFSACEDVNVLSKSVPPASNSVDSVDSCNVQWTLSQPSGSSSTPNFECGNGTVNVLNKPTSSADVKDSEKHTNSSTCSANSTTYLKSVNPSTTVSKKEKKKTKLIPGLALKKKNIPNLVQKWQKIKEEQEKEAKKPED